jgi:hypothetical protein
MTRPLFDKPGGAMTHGRAVSLARLTAVCSAFGLLILLAAKPLQHDDLFFHLRTGALISDTGAIPHSDSFSHTAPGAAWTTHEWGFALLVYGVFRLSGYTGLVWLTSFLALAVFSLTYLVMRRVAASASPILIPVLGLGMIAAEKPGFILRAALVSSLAFALLQYLLHLHHAQPRRSLAFAIVALFWVWSNVHVGVMFGLVVMWLYWAQATWDAWRVVPTRRWQLMPRCGANAELVLVLACMLATLANANGFKLWTFPFELNRLYYHSGLTWTLNMFRPARPDTQPFFFALLACALFACLPLTKLREALIDRRSPFLMQSLCAMFFLVLALRSTRFIPEFVIFALPLCAALWGSPSRWAVQGHWAGAAAVLAVAALLHPRPPSSPISSTSPERAAEFMEREQIRGRMFNYESWGGYLGWRLNLPVYWDGRNDVFGAVAKEFAYTDDFARLVRRHGLDMLVLDRRYHEKLSSYLRSARAQWALVYFDDLLALYVRKDKHPRSLVENHEYRLLQPFGVPERAELQRIAKHPVAGRVLEAEITRLQHQNRSMATYLRDELARARADLTGSYRASP